MSTEKKAMTGILEEIRESVDLFYQQKSGEALSRTAFVPRYGSG